MLQTLYGRLLVVILGFGLAMTLIFAVILLGYHEAYHVEADQTVHRRLAQQYADARLLISDEPLSVQNFHRGLAKLAELNPDVDLYLLDANGALVASSVPEQRLARRQVDLRPIERFLAGSVAFPIFGDDPRDARSQEIFSVAPVAILDCPARYLYVVLTRGRYEQVVSQLRKTYTINQSLGLLISCGVLAVAATLVLIRSITRRLSTLKAEMEHFLACELPDQPGFGGPGGAAAGDEIDRLAMFFRTLAGRVRAQMEALRETDETRRDMIANISHDLRTPLATLQAHLDTMALKQGILTAEERQDYLAIATRQCQRLARMVEQLLDLSKLDAGQIVPNSEPFQLAEIVQDIAQKFSLAAAARQVTIQVEQTGDLPLVVGDIGLIEQAIDNLTENAIQHSNCGGLVTLRTMLAAADTVRLEVEDCGPGIAAAEQTRIFDRFYRGDCSRGTNSGHAGLGLAIAKAIFDLHHATITVQSMIGAGTCFRIDLAAQPADSAKPGTG